MAMVEAELMEEVAAWRRAIHADPEFGFEVQDTAAFVAGKLRSFGVDVTEGVGGTGVVGVLRKGNGPLRIGLRADMDALQITEQNVFDHVSRRPGYMHACGHDGHTAMLLGAARILAREVDFDGIVTFVFQPAEEHGRGAGAMIDDGLFERFDIDEIYAVHNYPEWPLGTLATRAGPAKASEDNFEIRLVGKGGHAARPHMLNEALVAGCQLVVALQTIVSRRADPLEHAVLSVTEFVTDGIRNVLPGNVTIRGDVRSFTPKTQELVEGQIRQISAGIAATFGLTESVDYSHEFAATTNSPAETERAYAAARAVRGMTLVADCPPVMASDDFGLMLQHRPGNYAFLGNGTDSYPLHNPLYDFNDRAIPFGVGYFVELVRQFSAG
ncbi:amidohydrolase [Sphingosinicella rhizophila]|uniref:Amidohydrolase n=1 Tax=Sphingosinicella rhizophila TaxID=3050082 RepID=A0ABU3Q6D8_9SPHN|nr:amidohydrolase [Sphingosinicella sp. GR2756]MDT9598495.1 amidohydrolase [Sphingosinicella sp. GR2756]